MYMYLPPSPSSSYDRNLWVLFGTPSFFPYSLSPSPSSSSSYLHAEWVTFDKLLQGDPRFDGKVKRYKAKQASLGIFSNVDDEPFNPEYTVVDRALDVATQAEANGEVGTYMYMYIVLLYCTLYMCMFIRVYCS